MKKNLKTILLIIWALISLKIIWLTGGFVLKVLIAFLLKALHMSDMFAYKYIWKYFPAKPINEDDYGAVSLLIAYLHPLLFFFVLSTWVLYFLLKKPLKYAITKPEYFVIIIILAMYTWFLIEIDIFAIVYNANNILNVLKNTNFLLILQTIIALTLIINISSVIHIFRINIWPIAIKFLFSFIILGGGLFPCAFVAFVIIWDQGALALALKDISFETRTIEEIIHTIYNTYGLNVSWCHPEKIQPCAELQESMRRACTLREFTSQLPIGGKRIKTNIVGQMLPVLADVKDSCSEFRGWYDLCMQEEARDLFIKRWKNFNSIAAETKASGFKPVDTWSWAIKKK